MWRRTVILLLFIFQGFGCTAIPLIQQYGPIGSPFKSIQISHQQPSPFATSDPELVMLGLASSGGGSRSAYLTAAILREIRALGIRLNPPLSPGGHASLLSQLDYVSAVSGGAVSAAYFVANLRKSEEPADSDWWEEYLNKMAKNYRQRQWYWLGILNPLTWIKVLFTNYNRGHIARDDYDNVLYHGKTLAELPLRPALYLNASDVGNQIRFIFSKHYIDTDFYPSEKNKLWYAQSEPAYEITNANDLGYVGVDPGSVKIADAVYASSAFPFVYPNLALKHLGRNKRVYRGNLLFLADGGLMDNSGLLTLLTQMRYKFTRSAKTRFVLAIYIDASLGGFDSGTRFQARNIEETYAWRNTYIGHGTEAVNAGIDNHENTVFRFLEGTGVLINEFSTDPSKLGRLPADTPPRGRASWWEDIRERKLLLRPLVISLRLRDIVDAYYQFRSTRAGGADALDPRLVKLFEESEIPSGLDELRRGEWPAATNAELQHRVSDIATDFTLSDKHRKVLDLAAYLLVHGKLRPALSAWNELAQASLKAAN